LVSALGYRSPTLLIPARIPERVRRKALQAPEQGEGMAGEEARKE
jgi:hypothetical protein